MAGTPKENTSFLASYHGFRSRTVNIGGLLLGGDQPIRVQSMTNTLTLDTDATVQQVADLARAGCDIVRITAQNMQEARHLAVIRKKLRAMGILVPLVADIHYLPGAAEEAARIVEKVRINPGNYSEKRQHGPSVYTESEYSADLEQIAGRLFKLISICRENGTALRIGVNHGSLSRRIMNRYGDTPAGMVESALEFARICRDSNFNEVVISMKSSNLLVVLHSNRLLAAKMMEEGLDYPIHLGVTEAGDGEDARIKSAAGIGILLEEGIGDTIRVSLTEDPVNEVPFARQIGSFYESGGKRALPGTSIPAFHQYRAGSNERDAVGFIGGSNPPVVIGRPHHRAGKGPTPDIFYEKDRFLDIYNDDLTDRISRIKIPDETSIDPGVLKEILLVEAPGHDAVDRLREFFRHTGKQGIRKPVIIHRDYRGMNREEMLIRSSVELGSILTDGMGDGIWIDTGEDAEPEYVTRLSFGILQACRRRISHTEYIACPSCGRTRFDIQAALARVKLATGHLKGLKIAVMGCIVNGPGEMADADYGYVGAGKGKVSLYKGHEMVRRNVPEDRAVEELLDLINKDRGKILG